MIKKETLYDFDDLVIEPILSSSVRSRSECDPYYEDGMLPIFTAPMDTVVNMDNAEEFINNRINVILPRGQRPGTASTNSKLWFSYGLEEFKEVFLSDFVIHEERKKIYALIDVANGHMNDLRDTVIAAKKKYGSSLVLMVGNVANPATYRLLAKAGADFIRVGIGNGGGCLTTEQTGVGFPMASLVDQCSQEKFGLPTEQKAHIVADGGIKKYADVVKALALGADYVMMGSVLNKALESCAETYVSHLPGDYHPIKIGDTILRMEGDEGSTQVDKAELIRGMKAGCLYKKYRGMSTKEVQESWGKKPKTSEGVVKMQKVEYTLQGWVDNFESYLKSAMSYTGSRTLTDFKGVTYLNVISQNAFKRYNK
jgi:GMP reductase